MTSIQKKRKAFVEASYCVACGCCVKVCPASVIEIREAEA
nr:4Fe-4S binding protein [uncultured Anaerostipes sp.]